MTKHEALKELAGVIRESPVRASRLESGPAPLSPLQRYLSSNTASTKASGGSSLFSLLAPTLSGNGGSGGSLLDAFLGARQGSSSGGFLGAGLSPVVSGLLGLFGKGGKSGAPALPLYSAPQRVQVRSGLQGGVVSGADSNQSGGSRLSGGSAQPQVTLHIQAMDTQSILNRSSDIAQAVRQAMLQSHPINDVVADL